MVHLTINSGIIFGSCRCFETSANINLSYVSDDTKISQSHNIGLPLSFFWSSLMIIMAFTTNIWR
jgi:hypothetical protein